MADIDGDGQDEKAEITVKLFWGSSALDAPIGEMLVEDVDNDGCNELGVLYVSLIVAFLFNL